MHKRLVLLIPVVLFSITAVALAQSSGSLTLFWWTIDGGGGRLTSNTFTLDSTVAQPDAGMIAGGPYTLYSGFWGPVRQATPPPPGCPDVYEPNDDFNQAKPITPGTTIRAYICTEHEQDFYKFTVVAGQHITVSLTDIPAGQDYDLYLDDPSQVDVAKSNQSGDADERIEYTATVGGTYYVIVTGYSGHSTTQPYSLRVDVSGGQQRHYIYVPVLQKKEQK